MSVVFENHLGCYVSSEIYLNSIYKDCQNSPLINTNLFKILSTFCVKKATRKTNIETHGRFHENEHFTELANDVEHVKNIYKDFKQYLLSQHLLSNPEECRKNTEALLTADHVYAESEKKLIRNSWGSNIGPPIVKVINNSKFLFPENAIFYSKDVANIESHLENKKFDLILLDPPWYNKYIKRKRKKNSAAYSMMSNEELKKIPVEKLLNNNGIVVVWCTNCQNHLDDLKNNIFKKWDIQFVAKWYWLKITKSGEPVCNYSEPPGKQPFEQIIIASKTLDLRIPKTKLVVSVPSAIHSHKPPLIELLKQFLPENPECLEIFARYLLPNWTSYGNEVLRFQHESLYIFKED